LCFHITYSEHNIGIIVSEKRLANMCKLPSLRVECIVHSSMNSTVPSPSPHRSHLTPVLLCNRTQFHRQWYNIIPT
jgi:hypothetical protein